MAQRLLAAFGLLLLFGATAAARTAEQKAQPMTLAKVRGTVDALAQEGNRIAWINIPARCGRQVQILTLPGRRPVSVGSSHGWSCTERGGLLRAIALTSDGRAFWQALSGFGNTVLDFDVLTAGLPAPRTRLVAGMEVGYDAGNPDDYFGSIGRLPLVADGKKTFFYAQCDTDGCSRALTQPGIYRVVGLGWRRLARVTKPVGLALSGRRVAAVTNSPRCCNFTPVWSHDGTRLAWIYDGNLWTVRADGTGERELVAGASLPSWSPDDTRLVFERAEANRQHSVYRVHAAGGGLQRLAAGTSPVWSPSGTTIAFVRGKNVYAINDNGTGVRRLTPTGRPTAGPLSWSPDSTRIAVSRGGDIYSIRADGGGETRLTTSRRAEGQPAWSPSGAKVAYIEGSSIDVVNADGTGATRLTKGTDVSPAWSLDSKRIAFIRVEDEQGDLWVMNMDGNGQRRLVPSTRYANSPQWRPDDSTIAIGDWFEYGNWPSNPGIRLVSPTSGKATKIAPVRQSPVAIRNAVTGRLINRFTVEGVARAIALGPAYLALLVDHNRRLRVELYNLKGTFRVATDVPSSTVSLSAAGRNVIFASSHVIRRLDAQTGAVTALATADRTAVGLTIEGRRVVWAENNRGVARIRAVTAP